jgi:S1-C subfamily serine protease
VKRVAVYSNSTSRSASPQLSDPADVPSRRQPSPGTGHEQRKSWRARHGRALRAGAAVFLLALLGFGGWAYGPQIRGMSQAQVGTAIQQAIEANAPPALSDAYGKILPSLVNVRALTNEGTDGEAGTGQIGTGVVIVETGIILTNLHVVRDARHVKVTFYNGLQADAEVVSQTPEHDLAVLQAKRIPDDLVPATLRTTAGLRPGDPVLAVGFPFGIGPSASAGVISGLKRQYRSPSGDRHLNDLIQFDAAVNPGNSGGPLVTREGDVIGIVTGLLNPTEQRVFIGIGFAIPIEKAAGAAGLTPF